MLQIISPGSDQAATLAHSRVGVSGSTRTERPVALGSLNLLDDENLSSPMASDLHNCALMQSWGRSFLERRVGLEGCEGRKLSEGILVHTLG